MVDKGNRLKALLGGKERVSDGSKEKPQPGVVIKDEEKEQKAAVKEDNGLNGKSTNLKHQTFLLDIDDFNRFRLKVMEYNIKIQSKRISQSEIIRMFVSYANKNGIEETIKTIREGN